MVRIMKKPRTVICDIDGCIMRGPWFEDIQDFYDNMDSWQPVDWMVDIVTCIYKLGYRIIFLTARDEKVRRKTTRQLKDMFDFRFDLYMRPTGDERPSHIVKEEFLLKLQEHYNIIFAIDDEQPNCDMYRKHGIDVIQPNIS